MLRTAIFVLPRVITMFAVLDRRDRFWRCLVRAASVIAASTSAIQNCLVAVEEAPRDEKFLVVRRYLC